MQLHLNGKNLYIVKKKPQQDDIIEIISNVLKLKDKEGNILKQGQIDLQQDTYACLYCRQLKNITFIVCKEGVFSASLIMAEETQFEAVLKLIGEACPTLEPSEQNAKINGYAASLVEKLQEGVTVTIMDTKEEESIKCCPVCGMQCDPNIPYCMECGASV